jgi:hypothetical protein
MAAAGFDLYQHQKHAALKQEIGLYMAAQAPWGWPEALQNIGTQGHPFPPAAQCVWMKRKLHAKQVDRTPQP